MRRGFGLIVLALMGLLSGLACNLSNAPSTQSTETPSPTLVNDGTRPAIVIVNPQNGAQGVVREPIVIKVHATDGIGISRVMMRESGRVVVMQPSPDSSQVFEALLSYTPTAVGNVTLEVIAYRGTNIASDPASVTVQIVATRAELRNPGSLDATAGIASGNAICTARVNIDNLNLRSGPGTNYKRVTQLEIGEMLDVIGRNDASTWFQVKRQSNAQDGWVSAQYIQQNGDCSRAPIIVVPAP